MGKLKIFFLGLVLLNLAGCAGTGGAIVKQYIGRHLTVAISPDIPFPDEMTFEGLENTSAGSAVSLADEVLGQFTGMTLKRRLSNKLADRTGIYRRALTESFRKQLRDQRVFAAVLEEGGDVELKLKVERYGLKVRSSVSDLKPILEVQAALRVAGIGQVWSETLDVPDYSTQVLAFALEAALENKDVFQTAFSSATEMAAEELVRRMR